MRTTAQSLLHHIVVVTGDSNMPWQDFITAEPLTNVAYSFIRNRDGSITETESLDDLDPLASILASILLRMKEVDSLRINHRKLAVKIRQGQSWLKVTAQVIGAICCIKDHWSLNTINAVQVKLTDVQKKPTLAHFIDTAA